ncbi:MAG TPA: hypothetical protein VED40_22905 [Azospirillaceae bacterium]|nr:hypothetical protein [Azospirillaceae bacterium]
MRRVLAALCLLASSPAWAGEPIADVADPPIILGARGQMDRDDDYPDVVLRRGVALGGEGCVSWGAPGVFPGMAVGGVLGTVGALAAGADKAGEKIAGALLGAAVGGTVGAMAHPDNDCDARDSRSYGSRKGPPDSAYRHVQADVGYPSELSRR